jgi:hypothetical protein
MSPRRDSNAAVKLPEERPAPPPPERPERRPEPKAAPGNPILDAAARFERDHPELLFELSKR